MSDEQKRRPILLNGEYYGDTVKKKSSSPGNKTAPWNFEDARDSILQNIQGIRSEISKNSTRFLPTEFVIGIKTQPGYTAKSYYPNSIFDGVNTKFGFHEIGSRTLTNPNKGEKNSRLFFVRAKQHALDSFENALKHGVSKEFRNQICTIERFGIPGHTSQLSDIPKQWEYGKLEAVLHPFEKDQELALEIFIERIKNQAGKETIALKHKRYSSGITFVSFEADTQILQSLSGYNPLRTIHPLQFRQLPTYTRQKVNNGPLPPSFVEKSPIMVGVLDGGFHPSNPFASKYTEIGSTSLFPVSDFLDHGTYVTGAVLFGALNDFPNNLALPEPKVSVRNFSVIDGLSTDPDLYDTIDKIEELVPKNEDITVYNLSLGPSGPILDDSISRFTYACDKLAFEHDKLFCVAVGNDGEEVDYDRIQSPADGANVIGVGAYSRDRDQRYRAPYSCVGPGREGGKLKPDIMAFGGCDLRPIHLIGDKPGSKIWATGTSFASPIVAGVAGRLIGESNGSINCLSAKALICHAAEKEQDKYNHQMGNGCLPEDFETIVDCDENSFTVIYQAELMAGKYAQYQVPWDSTIADGKVELHWSIAVLTDVDEMNSDDYTSSSVEFAFYPNSEKYKFTNPLNSKQSKTIDISKNKEAADTLLEQGWTKSSFPVTASVKNPFIPEEELRTRHMKWDSFDSRCVKKAAKGLDNPFFIIHALSRGSRNQSSKVKFAVVLTVRMPKAKAEIYSAIIQAFPALNKLQLFNPVDIRVNT